MATSIEALIQEALFTRLSSLVLSPVLPIAWPNVKFTPPANQKYLRAVFVPNEASRFLIDSDGEHQHVGLLQVSVYWTKIAVGGDQPAREVAALVAAHFTADLKLNSGSVIVRITKRPDVRDLIIEDAAVQIPVMIDWEVYA